MKQKHKLHKKTVKEIETVWSKQKLSTYNKKNAIANTYGIALPRMIVLKSRKDTTCHGCEKKIPKGSTYYKNVFYPLFTGISHLNIKCLKKVHRQELMGTPNIPAY